ncbi:MAG: molybdopterin molybdotransferase MoeA, partial [Nannocystaceae bacterium]|nr:molybdopterin molybdotransferase MoeA [Nannocystaceae bacterium]
AVRSADVVSAVGRNPPGSAVTLTATGESAAGHPSELALPSGQATRIFTGAVLPEDADAVVPQEDVDVVNDGKTTQLHIDAAAAQGVAAGRFVRGRASEVAAGDIVVPRGTQIDAGSLATLASAGHATVLVHRRPRVAILSTGDELVRIGYQPGPGQIVSSNALMLAAQVVDAGGEPVVLPDAGDDPHELRARLSEGLSADILVTSGGISVGDHDLVRRELEALGVEVHVHGLALRPGKPAAFGTRDTTLVFALPGNPASAWVTFLLLVQPALRIRTGERTPRPPLRLPLTTTAALRGAGPRAHYVRARWGRLPGTATPLSAQQSGNLRSIGMVDLLFIVPIGVEAVEAGDTCEAIILRPPAESLS